MSWLVALFLRWFDRKKTKVRFKWSGGYAGSSDYIEFGTTMTNDGTIIARDVVIRGYLDGDEVWKADPVDVPMEAAPIQVGIKLRHPDQADLSPALNNRPVFHGKRFTATATVGKDVLTIGWPHEEEPEQPASLTPDEEARELRREYLKQVIEKEDG